MVARPISATADQDRSHDRHANEVIKNVSAGETAGIGKGVVHPFQKNHVQDEDDDLLEAVPEVVLGNKIFYHSYF